MDRQKELYSNQQMIQHCLISLLDLHLLVTPIDSVGTMMDLVTYQSSMVLLSVEHMITMNPLSTHTLLMMKVTLLILQQYLVTMLVLVHYHKEKQTMVPLSLLKQHIL